NFAPFHREEHNPVAVPDIDLAAGERIVAKTPGRQCERLIALLGRSRAGDRVQDFQIFAGKILVVSECWERQSCIRKGGVIVEIRKAHPFTPIENDKIYDVKVSRRLWLAENGLRRPWTAMAGSAEVGSLVQPARTSDGETRAANRRSIRWRRARSVAPPRC